MTNCFTDTTPRDGPSAVGAPRRTPGPAQAPRIALALCSALVVGLLLASAPAPAAAAGEPPEAPITGQCHETEPGFEVAGEVRLCGTLNPNAPGRTGYYFLYNAGTSFFNPNVSCTGGSRTRPGEEVEGEAIVVESEALGGLLPNTFYTYCLVATNLSGGETFGQPAFYKTLGMPPLVTEESARTVGTAGAVLKAQVDPRNDETSYFFEYSTIDARAEGERLGGGELAAGIRPQTVEASIAGGLAPNTTYYYQVSAHNGSGTSSSPIESFMTPAAMPEATTGPAQSVGQSTATLTGTLNPLNASTSYWFQYGTSDAYLAGVPAVYAGTGTTALAESTTIEGLAPATTYHYRIVASNVAGTAYGADQTFVTTPPSPSPLPAAPVFTPVTTHATTESPVPPKKRGHAKSKKKHRKTIKKRGKGRQRTRPRKKHKR